MAMQLRVNAETMQADGSAKPSGGTIHTLRLPGGPGVRVDTHVTSGSALSPAYDSLLAKIIVDLPAGDHAQLVAKAARALAEFEAAGVATNAPFLAALLADARRAGEPRHDALHRRARGAAGGDLQRPVSDLRSDTTSGDGRTRRPPRASRCPSAHACATRCLT